jgi:hypothetical protein
MAPAGEGGMLDRIIRAIQLDSTLYRQVADDERFAAEGVMIVAAVAFLSAIGAAVGSGRPLLSFVAELANSVIFGWLLWAFVAYLVGTLLGGHSGMGEMARTLAYANAPRFIALLGFIPCLGPLFRLAAWLLSIAAGVIAIRESMGFDTMKAVVTAVIGLAVYVIASLAISLSLGGLGILGRMLGR